MNLECDVANGARLRAVATGLDAVIIGGMLS